MIKKILIPIILLSFFACKVTEKPEFVKVNNIKVLSVNATEVVLQTDLLFLNKNSVGGNLQADNIKVFVDSVQVATMQTELFKVPKKSEFNIPLKATIPYKMLFKNKSQNLLGNIMNIIMQKNIFVQIEGKVKYKLGAFQYNYPLKYEDQIKIPIK